MRKTKQQMLHLIDEQVLRLNHMIRKHQEFKQQNLLMHPDKEKQDLKELLKVFYEIRQKYL